VTTALTRSRITGLWEKQTSVREIMIDWCTWQSSDYLGFFDVIVSQSLWEFFLSRIVIKSHKSANSLVLYRACTILSAQIREALWIIRDDNTE
jgi:hypothetical protein